MVPTLLATAPFEEGFHVQRSLWPTGTGWATSATLQPYLSLVVRGSFNEWTPAGFHRRREGSAHFHSAGELRHGAINEGPVEIISVVALGERLLDLKWDDPGPDVPDVSHGKIPFLLRRLGTLANAERRRAGSLVPALGAELFFELAKFAGGVVEKTPNWLDVAKALLLQGVSVRLVAFECEVHPASFARSFRRWTGVLPGEFARQYRLEEARKRVLGEEKIGLIAAELGFADQSHLAREFRRRYGVSPDNIGPADFVLARRAANSQS